MSIQTTLFKTEVKAAKVVARTEDIIGGGFDLDNFVTHFDVLVEASKGVKNLRSFVLKLGLAGRLGTNDPGEPPPHVPGGKAPPSVAVPYPNWVVRQLPDVADIEMGNSPPGTSYNEHGEGVPLINGPVEFSPGPFGLTRRTKFTTAPARMCRRGDLLVCVRGATTGRTNIADFDACIGRGVALVRARTNQHYLNYFMWSVGNDLLAAGTGTTFPAIARDDLNALVVLLPPLAEQKRIVAKVDQLMALCDDLEARQAKKRETGTRLTKSALEALTTAEGPEEFDVAWKRVVENFDVLIDRAEKVGELRAAIFGLACRGALTSRVSGSGADVLNCISERRSMLAKDEAAKGNREVERHVSKLDAQTGNTPSVSLPTGWVWATLLGTCVQLVDCHNKTAPYSASGIMLVRTSNIRDGKIRLEGVRYVTKETYAHWSRRCPPREGDVLFTREAPMGEVGVIEPGMELCMGQRMMLLRVAPDLIDPRYLLLAMRDPAFQTRMSHAAVGSTVKHLRVGDVESLFVPIPATSEQKMIVGRVEELMKICDDLEAKLRRAEDRASKLVEAVVQELVA